METQDIQKSVNKFNKYAPRGMKQSYKYAFSITHEIMKKMTEEDFHYLLRYTMNQSMMIKYFPHKLIFHEFDGNGEEGGEYTFFYWCE